MRTPVASLPVEVQFYSTGSFDERQPKRIGRRGKRLRCRLLNRRDRLYGKHSQKATLPFNRSREFGGYSTGTHSKEPSVALKIQAVPFGGHSTDTRCKRFFRCPDNPCRNVRGVFHRSTGIFITEVLIYNQSKPPVQTLKYIVCTGSRRPTSSTGKKTVTLLCDKTFP